MSKYIIELDYDLQRVVGVGVKQGTVWVKDYDVDDLEELCADYINEHFGELQDQAYQKGLEDGKQTVVGAAELREKLEYQKGFKDGKAIHEKGCDGCEFESRTNPDAPCLYCSNNFKNLWRSKKPIDDKIVVGDWVNIKNTDEELGIVTKEHGNQFYVLWADGSSGLWSSKSVVKTGRHFDIDKILDEMKGTGTDDDTY